MNRAIGVEEAIVAALQATPEGLNVPKLSKAIGRCQKVTRTRVHAMLAQGLVASCGGREHFRYYLKCHEAQAVAHLAAKIEAQAIRDRLRKAAENRRVRALNAARKAARKAELEDDSIEVLPVRRRFLDAASAPLPMVAAVNSVWALGAAA